jgi:GT2 family glycosyltransferase
MAMNPGGATPEETPRRTGAPSVLAIIVTHSGRRWFKESLVALSNQTYEAMDVLVLDDASSDSRQQPHLKRVAKRHLKRRRWGYLRTPRPLGYGGALNWALSRVRSDADLLLFIHDDAALDPDAVEKMVGRLEADETTAIVGPKLVSWDDPQMLEEVGMAADRFGFPYKGLEEGEIDLGQHDRSSEVFYITSTCMLIRHDVFRRLRGWDAQLRAFAEDLDLCWRARLAGFMVRVEPEARARHAVALARGERESPFGPARYFIRRNRLRTVLKNVSTVRLLLLVPQFILLSLIEMAGFIVLRQPGEIWNLARGLGWNFLRLPQTLTERRKVQRQRQVSDLKLQRLTVRQSTRIRSYISYQRDRLEEAWGRRAELVAQRSARAKVVSSQMKGWLGFALSACVIALLLGFRHIWWSDSLSVGELLPYPDSMTALLRAFAAPWRVAGLGQPDAAPPALGLLGFFPLITFGAAGAAQKLLVATLGVAAFVGAYRLVSDFVDRPGRFVAGGLYLLGAVGYAGIRTGSLGALIFGACAPFVLRSMARVTGWSRPPRWNRSSTIAQIALGGAISAAFIPGSLFMYLFAAALLAAGRAFFVRGEKAVHGFLLAVLGIVIAWILLLPWSLSWGDPGGPLWAMRADGMWQDYAHSFRGHDMLSVVLGQTPEVPVFFGLALTVLGVIAVVAAEGQRRRFALAMWGLIAVTGLLSTAFEAGVLRPFLASPVEAGVLAAVAFSALGGLALGAFRLDLPRRGFGWVHWVTIGGLAVSVFLTAWGLGPAIWHGGWTAGGAGDEATVESVHRVRTILDAERAAIGPFRALWVGSGWNSPVPTSSRPFERTFLSGPRGAELTALFETQDSSARDELARVISSIEDGSTDRGGALLGAFSVHFVVIERDEDIEPWLQQRDLALVRSEENFLLFENARSLARAGIYQDVPAYVTAVEENDPALTANITDLELEKIDQIRSYRYVDEQTSSGGVVFLAEAEHPDWHAELNGERLERIEGGWGNAFSLESETGRLTVAVDRSLKDVLWILFALFAWVVTFVASFPREKALSVPGVRKR